MPYDRAADQGATSYAYDLAGHLSRITTGGGTIASFTIDALGRLQSRTVGSVTDTYGYVGTGDTAFEIATSGASTTDCLIGPSGERIARLAGSSGAWTLYDLHGDIVGSEAAGAVSSALRYDPYGQTIAAWTSGSGGPALAWRYQGRLDVSPDSNPLYAAGARLYSPSVGTFTGFDSVAGSGTDPITMNRYLYAGANPATLVDPSGHSMCTGGMSPLAEAQCEAAQNPAPSPDPTPIPKASDPTATPPEGPTTPGPAPTPRASDPTATPPEGPTTPGPIIPVSPAGTKPPADSTAPTWESQIDGFMKFDDWYCGLQSGATWLDAYVETYGKEALSLILGHPDVAAANPAILEVAQLYFDKWVWRNDALKRYPNLPIAIGGTLSAQSFFDPNDLTNAMEADYGGPDPDVLAGRQLQAELYQPGSDQISQSPSEEYAGDVRSRYTDEGSSSWSAVFHGGMPGNLRDAWVALDLPDPANADQAWAALALLGDDPYHPYTGLLRN